MLSLRQKIPLLVSSLGPGPNAPARQEPSLLRTGHSPDQHDRQTGMETPTKRDLRQITDSIIPMCLIEMLL